MPKEEWGVKRLCPTTGKRFYDLNKSPVISPYTGEVVPTEQPGRKGVTAATESNKSKSAPKAEPESEDALLDDEDDVAVEADDELLEDEDDDTVSFDELGDVADDSEDDS
ncbi:TIGR02300 family protein [Rhodobacter sp. NTK016B]|uniref:TIGR02300 family protein n=1 Tax=Rhodobacter sp. NTK016B TaxID=2759676 RepID=UPI001A8EF5A3|nr:TIGR02300 family protein [Rhodobacter sp. NTK016B]MBN8293369.1 TIGR02300 family protein [Rhodobacter sp. NTK016B]